MGLQAYLTLAAVAPAGGGLRAAECGVPAAALRAPRRLRVDPRLGGRARGRALGVAAVEPRGVHAAALGVAPGRIRSSRDRRGPGRLRLHADADPGHGGVLPGPGLLAA